MMALKLAVLVLNKVKVRWNRKEIADLFGGWCNFKMCPTSLHQICVTCSPQCMEMWLEAGEHLSFCQFARAVGFLKACLPTIAWEEQKKRQKMSKDRTQLEPCHVPVILSDPAQRFQTLNNKMRLTKQRAFLGDLCSKDAIVQKL